MAKSKKINIEDVTLDVVKHSQFGCRNCLWCGCECVGGEKFQPKIALEKYASCKAYAYYD